MTLKIKNIRYDHGLSTQTYPEGVLTIDSTDNSIHVHDGVQPNGVRLPTAADMNDKADVSLGNVSQEELTNLLSRYGALSLNDNKAISETQRNNAWDKLGGPAMRFDTEVPEHNVAVVNKDTHKLEVKDFATMMPFGFGIDTASAVKRVANVEYTATRNCFVSWGGTWEKPGWRFWIDGVVVMAGSATARRGGTDGIQICPVAKGQKYRVEPLYYGQVVVEYGVKPFTME